MTAAEFKIKRERLGVSGRWLADRVGVLDRQVRRWESGVAPVPADVVKFVDDLDAEAGELARKLRGASRPLVSYRNDGEFWAADGDAEARALPASFYRAVLGRIFDSGVSVVYPVVADEA
ncbi:hypothetical protein QN357_01525 [Cryobacterium sp. RTC2.1]|uniref:hypothetical protein n=1 Tax=Cryobacterium sp. RTC2.1 TaxID=3048634 RepID=UPI002B23A75E|nr:hypothetical protein [Cryobacterium sp. RTC2.1]MEB0001616.1 hypothetical protein [Cryobacterium sp. RTC2.1]